MENTNDKKLLVLLLNDVVLFPSSEIRLELNELSEKQLISLSEGYYNSNILIVNPTKFTKKMKEKDLPQIGVVAQIKMRMDMPNGKTRIVLYGLRRVYINDYIKEESNSLAASFEEIDKFTNDPMEEIVCVRKIFNMLETYINDYEYDNSLLNNLTGINSVDKITDLIAPTLPVDYFRKTEYIETINPIDRSKMIIEDINNDLKILELEKQIDEKLSIEIDNNQKEYVLREKIRIIKEELGDINDKDVDVENLRKRVNELNADEKIKKRIINEINKYETSNPNSPEIGMIRNYIDWLLDLPWNNYTEDNINLNLVKDNLDKTHYGLDIVKERILEYLAVKQNTNSTRSPIICLVGPPGVGKTSLAKSIAESLNRKCTKISVGGINDEAEIVGHRRTYIGAAPGLIVQGLKKAGSSNPVFIIDEIDKMTKDIKGDPASSLLEVLDPEQNDKFSDHYIEEPIDLSKVMFITTANYYEQIPSELLDRLEVIDLSSYTEYEKLDIAKRHLIPRQLKETGLENSNIEFSDDGILSIINNYTKEAGVRNLERTIASVLRKIVKKMVIGDEIKDNVITKYNMESYLGKQKYLSNNNDIIERIGVVNGMAYTQYGGDILPIEAVLFKGKGNIILTGSLGDVMKESAHLSYSYLKANADLFKIDYDKFENYDIHIHVPEGAVPKDGPSAGVTLTTTLLSLLTETTIPTSIAMTGEMTLRGKVLPIGGLKEKVIGAHRNGISTIFIPRQNEKDLEEIKEEIKNSITFILVDRFEDIKNVLFKLKRKGIKPDPRNIRLPLD